MKKKLIISSFIFWWAIMFPILNFTENDIAHIREENVQYKSFIIEILQ